MVLVKYNTISKQFETVGANADTLDGKHAVSFVQYGGVISSGSLLEYALALNGPAYIYVKDAVTGTPVEGQDFFAEIRKRDSTCEIVATRFNTGEVFTNCYNSGVSAWYGWKNLSDGGNAAKVGGAGLQTAAGTVGLHQMFTGTTAAAKANIPAGAWYGLHS